MINEHDVVSLTVDIKSEGLKIGDVGTVVSVYNRSDLFEVEFILDKGSIVVSLTENEIREINHL